MKSKRSFSRPPRTSICRFTIFLSIASALVTLIVVSLPKAQAQETTEICSSSQCDTGFRPDRHGWATRNTAYGFTRSTGFETLNGACYGMVRLAQVAFDPNRKNQTGLYADTRKMDGLARQLYAMTAHSVMSNDVQTFLASPRPSQDATFEGIRREIMASGRPQVLTLSSSDPDKSVGHALLVTGFRQDGDSIVFTVYDPNRPYREDRPRTETRLEYSKATASYSVRSSDGNQLYRNSKYDIVRHDRDDNEPQVIEKARLLIEDAKDGKINTKRGMVDLTFSAALEFRRSINITKDKKLGGVSVYYDPTLLDGEVDDEQVGTLLEELLENLSGGKSNITMRFDGGKEESFATLSLRGWLSTRSRTLGDLTRVRGFVRKENDLILIGQIETGRPKVDADLFLIALQAIYRDGRTPGVSLDLDERDPFGAQNTRVVDMPENLISTEYVRVMLDADYLMKRIQLGEEKITIPGFQSYFDLLQAQPGAALGQGRFWFAPIQSGAGDVLENGPAVLFESEVQVLSQRDKKTTEDIPVLRSGGNYQFDSEAARNLTRYFRDIEKERDDFYRLHQLFDVSKLCAILRHRSIQSGAIDDFIKITPRPVNRKDDKGNEIPMNSPFMGIGPKVLEGSGIVVGGGVDVRMRLAAGSFAHSDNLSGITAGETTLRLERSFQLDENAHLRLLSGVAAKDCLAGRFHDCVAKSTRILDDAPKSTLGTMVRTMRALGLFELGKYHEAIADISLIVKDNPDKAVPYALRATMKLFAGDLPGASLDASEATKYNPDETTWSIKAEIALLNLDFLAAEDAINKFAAFNPFNDDVERSRDQLRFFRKLPRADALRMVRSLLNRPIPLARAHLNGRKALAAGNVNTAIKQFELAFKLASEVPASRRSFMREEALFWIAISKTFPTAKDDSPPAPRLWDIQMPLKIEPPGGFDPDIGIKDAEKLIAMQPTWSSAYLLKALCLMSRRSFRGDQKRTFESDVFAILKKAFSSDPRRDPIFYQFGVFGSAEFVKRHFYALAYIRMAESGVKGGLFLRELAQSPTFQGKLAANILRINESPKSQQSAEALLKMIRPFAAEAINAKPDSEVGTPILCFMFFNFYGSVEDIVGNKDASFRALKAWSTYSPDETETSVIQTISLWRARGIYRYVEHLEERLKHDPELKRLIDLTSQGQPQLDEIRMRVSQLSQDFRSEPRANVSSLVRAANDLLLDRLPFLLQLWALDQNRKRADRKPDEVKRFDDLTARTSMLYNDRMRRRDDLMLILNNAKTDTDRHVVEMLIGELVQWDKALDEETKKHLRYSLAIIEFKNLIKDRFPN